MRTSLLNRRTIATLAAGSMMLAVVVPPASAHPDDVSVTYLGGRIVTGSSFLTPSGDEFIVPGNRVFSGELADLGGSIYASDPGFFSGPLVGETSARLPANSIMRFNILGSLLRWDVGTQSFSAITPGERLRIEFAAGALTRTSSLDGSPVAGFGFDTGPIGAFDEHYDFYLDPSAGQTAPGAGIYAIALDLSLDGLIGSTSLPYYVVLNYDSPTTQLQAAVDYVNTNIIPAPSAAVALLSAGLLGTRRRRRLDAH